ncbi:hypothetical protein [Halocatena salina]|uniref:Uncharacterized protein n=1 Tax=Halocatena salina TaxID=2934340 RepID=A0A8U0A660_9EURY|nr:hypothetical protein [Halocatena salina]UPM44366.1 hypothetical protein MW046_13010 [Halocatena salina]
MDPVQVPVVSIPANSFGLFLVGIGLLCLGLGVGWWWLRTAHEDEKSRVEGDNGNETARSSDDIPGDTGAFVFGTEGNDSDAFESDSDGTVDTDAVDQRE